ncbi:MAG: ATP-dependent zinc metalloprotease FtsH [Candidatus Cloacimonadota bacterium]|nr:ATP-dependent zinc metalloprotease FtsH [Candidatus Cloacimonadota bacterium]
MSNKDNKNNKKNKFLPNKNPKSITFWIVLLLIILVGYNMVMLNKKTVQEVNSSDLIDMIKNGSVKRAIFDGKDVNFFDFKQNKFHTYLPYEDPELVKQMQEARITVSAHKPSQLMGFLLSWFPFLLFIGFWLFMMRSMQGGASGKAFSFGKNKAKLFEGGKTDVSFDDVAGVVEAKEELEEIVEFLKQPEKFQKLGGRIPKGVLLLGRPGTGKTLLAKAVAGEAEVPFYSMSGSDFVEVFVGVGASRVRDLFAEAKKNAPCIAFIDEIDAVGRSRGAGLGGGHDEREQTLNQLLVEMDGFQMNDSVIIIAATNRPDVLDPALLRPGRFDRQVTVDLPDIKGREAILKVHIKDKPVSKNLLISVIARSTPGFSGADIANLVNEAALMAARKNKKEIEMEDFDEAKDKVTLGKAKKTKVISDEDKERTAYHELGHVICSLFLEHSEPVQKVTIIPRGWSGGATHYLEEERSMYSKSYLDEKLISLLGGRVAEELVFNELTTGAANDIERATDIAKKMVTQWGMSKDIGPITIGKEQQQVFLGKQLGDKEVVSADTANRVDAEIRRIIDTAYIAAEKLLKKHEELLHSLSKKLLMEETLNTEDLYSLIMKNISKEDEIIVRKKYDKASEAKIVNKNPKPQDENDENNDEVIQSDFKNRDKENSSEENKESKGK